MCLYSTDPLPLWLELFIHATEHFYKALVQIRSKRYKVNKPMHIALGNSLRVFLNIGKELQFFNGDWEVVPYSGSNKGESPVVF